jgi:hypothetical protein
VHAYLGGERLQNSATHRRCSRWSWRCFKRQNLIIIIMTIKFFFHWLYSPLGPWPLLLQFHDHFIVGRTPWTSDQLVARPLPKHRTTQTQNKHIHTPNIHALSGIRTDDPSFRRSEDSSCLRPLGYCDQQLRYSSLKNKY